METASIKKQTNQRTQTQVTRTCTGARACVPHAYSHRHYILDITYINLPNRGVNFRRRLGVKIRRRLTATRHFLFSRGQVSEFDVSQNMGSLLAQHDQTHLRVCALVVTAAIAGPPENRFILWRVRYVECRAVKTRQPPATIPCPFCFLCSHRPHYVAEKLLHRLSA